MNRNRLLWLDIARGFAIIFVVMSHSIQRNVVDWDNNLIFRINCSFFMPLFMFISGIATYISVKDKDTVCSEWIKKKFFSLFVPFFIWIFVPYILFSRTFPLSEVKKILVNIAKSPDHGLWFLYVLFILDVCFFCMYHIHRKIKIPYVILTIVTYYMLYAIIKYFHFNWLGIGLVKQYLRSFMSGFLIYDIHCNYLRLKHKKTEYIILLVLSLFFVLTVSFFHRTQAPLFMNYEFVKNLNMSMQHKLCWLYKTFIPYFGISCIFLISICFSKVKKLSFLISTIGKHTLEIYAMHFHVLGFVECFGNGYAGIILNAAVALMYSLLFAQLLRGCKLSKFLYGK